MSNIERIATRILASQGFIREAEQLARAYAAFVLPPSVEGKGSVDLQALGRLLLSASALALSDDDSARDHAAQIALAALRCSGECDALRVAAAHVLLRLANVPAVRLATERALVGRDGEPELPLALRMERRSLFLRHTIVGADGPSVSVNRFQGELWKTLQSFDWIGVSAPTSAGKSFILRRWVAEQLSEATSPLDLAFIVPSRALIGQVEREIADQIHELGIPKTVVLTMPAMVLPPNGFSRIFVMTQERIARLLSKPDVRAHPSLIIVDEAQKLGESYRGILLHQVIQRTVRGSPDAQVVFSSALARNPEALVEDAPDGETARALKAVEPNVIQNLYWVNQTRRRPQHWVIQHVWKSEPKPIGTVNLPFRPSTTLKRLAFVAHALGEGAGASIVYVNRAADAEDVAQLLYDLRGEETAARLAGDPDLLALAELSRVAVHEDYTLATVVERGVAFHYGSMPTILRQEIERAFSLGKLAFLVCTSTLLEGVNLPCRNIFIRNPKKGMGNPMQPADFWNLAGRAGRWGREFEGNIFCVDADDPEVWPLGTPKERTTYTLRSSAREELRDIGQFCDYLTAGAPPRDKGGRVEHEYLASYLASLVMVDGGLQEARWLKSLPKSDVRTIESHVNQMLDKLKVPTAVVLQNPGLSPVAIDALYCWLLSYGDLEQVMPPSPDSRFASREMEETMLILNRFFGPVFGEDKRRLGVAITVVNWMRGYTVARIIDERLRAGAGSRSRSSLIRATMDDVNEFGRFKVPKYLSCYVDSLRAVLVARKATDLLAELPEYEETLEYGLAQKTQLSLSAIGLSRTSTVLVSERIANDQLGPHQVLDWLRRNLRGLGLPAAVAREVEHAMSREDSIRGYYAPDRP